MDTPDKDFILIEDFLKGNLDASTKEAVLKRLSSDDAFYQDFQLWTNLDNWLEEISAFKIRQALGAEVNIRETIPLYKRSSFIFSMACSILLLIGFGWYYYEANKTVPQLAGEFPFAEINASQSGSGMLGGDDSKANFYNQPFEAVVYQQKDTTYQFSYDPIIIKFRLPKVYKDFGKDLKIIYDYKSNKYTMTLGNQAFNIEESKEWKKLSPLVITK